MPFSIPPSHLPLLLHLLIETPASLSFLLNPESQLPLLSSSPSFPSSPPTSSSSSSSSSCTTSTSKTTETTKTTQTTQTTQITPKEATEARLILSNLGGLLLSVNLVAIYLLFSLKGISEEIKAEVVRGVTGALGVYHAFPAWRAWKRMRLAKHAERQEIEGERWKGKEKVDDKTQKTLGGPVVHFFIHVLVGGLMGAVGLGVL